MHARTITSRGLTCCCTHFSDTYVCVCVCVLIIPHANTSRRRRFKLSPKCRAKKKDKTRLCTATRPHLAENPMHVHLVRYTGYNNTLHYTSSRQVGTPLVAIQVYVYILLLSPGEKGIYIDEMHLGPDCFSTKKTTHHTTSKNAYAYDRYSQPGGAEECLNRTRACAHACTPREKLYYVGGGGMAWLA